MIQVNLDMMLVRRKMNLSELAAKVDITLANLSILKTGKAKAIRFETLAKICAALDCQPGDLLEFLPERFEFGNEPSKDTIHNADFGRNCVS
jgi:putative transcriptional regulator